MYLHGRDFPILLELMKKSIFKACIWRKRRNPDEALKLKESTTHSCLCRRKHLQDRTLRQRYIILLAHNSHHILYLLIALGDFELWSQNFFEVHLYPEIKVAVKEAPGLPWTAQILLETRHWRCCWNHCCKKTTTVRLATVQTSNQPSSLHTPIQYSTSATYVKEYKSPILGCNQYLLYIPLWTWLKGCSHRLTAGSEAIRPLTNQIQHSISDDNLPISCYKKKKS